MFYIVIELAIIALMFLLGVTQIMLPAWDNTPFFPWFRRRKTLSRLKEAKEAIKEEELELEIQRHNEIVDVLRKERSGQNKQHNEETDGPGHFAA